MIPALKALVLTLAIAGVSVSGVAAEEPLTKAIAIHEEHLGEDSQLPEPAMKGQQTAYDHLVENQNRWMQNHANETADDDDGAEAE